MKCKIFQFIKEFNMINFRHRIIKFECTTIAVISKKKQAMIIFDFENGNGTNAVYKVKLLKIF